MSWWDTKNLTSFATQALKTAQKRIDKVLDINEDTDDGSREREDDGFFNKWLSPDKLMTSSTSAIDGFSSKDDLWSESKNEQTLSGSEYEEQILTSQSDTAKQKLHDSQSLKSFEIFTTTSKLKTSSIGSRKSAFKKFRNAKDHSFEENVMLPSHLHDKSDIIHKDETSLCQSPADTEVQDDCPDKDKNNEQEVTFQTSEHDINIEDHEEGSSSCLQVEYDISRHSTQESSTFTKEDPNPEEVEQRSGHNLLSMATSCGDVDVSKCWSDATLSQMVVSMVEETADESQMRGEAEHEDISGERDVINSTEADGPLVDSSEFHKEKKAAHESCEVPSEKEDQTHNNSCIVESTSGATLVTESSLENSTCTSDDLSESNKTLTGDEGVFLLANFSTLSESHVDTLHANSLNCTEFGEAEEERSEKALEVSQSPDIIQGMIEEAMNEEGHKKSVEKSEDGGSPGRVGGHSGDKMGSEVSMPAESGQTSGHTSADEIDTTTSSDIEIISHMSTPSFMGGSWRPPTGDKQAVTISSGAPIFCDLSPRSKGTTARTGSPSGVIGHRRSDSGSSGQSLQSRNGEDFVSIDYASTKSGFVDVRHRRNVPTDVMHQLSTLTSENESMMKKISELEEILEVREKKVLELSQENLDLRESKTILRNQLLHEEIANEAEKEDLRSLSDEFTKRIGDSEKRFQAAMREKDALKKALLDAEAEKKSNSMTFEKLMKEKEQTIAELLAEGEKLSKQQLQLNTAVKKLRVKDKENENLIKSLRDKSSEQNLEIGRLENILESKLESEKKYVESINNMNAILKANEEEISRLKNDLEDAQEKSRSFKNALDNSYREISELHKARMSDITEAQRAAASVEMSAKEELLRDLDEQRLNAKKVENQLVLQIEDLQLSMTRMEKEHGRREDSLRQEVSDLQQRLQEAEERNQELTQSVSTATRPLLRQIENIQSTFAIQSTNFERIERNLSDRLAEAQNQLVSAVEKERNASENLMELSTRVNSLDIQVSSLRQDKARLQAELEMERSKLGVLEETKHTVTAQKDTLIRKLEEEIKELKKEKIVLENQVEVERMKADVEKKKNLVICDQLKEKEVQLQNWSLKSTPTPQPSEDVLRYSVTSTPTNDDNQERSMNRSFYLEGGGRQSVYESIRGASGSTIIENLQSQLKLRQGEISQLLSNISELERTRESLSQELVNVSVLNEELQSKLEFHSELENQFKEVSDRHNALLQMYGEKVEEAEELRMDLQDIKEIYKCQMDELLKLKSQHIPS